METAIDICIGSYNTKPYLIKCIESFRKYTFINHNLFVVDNGSKDGSVEWLTQQKDIILLCNEKSIGYGASVNQGLRLGNNPYVCVASADIELIDSNWERMIDILKQPLVAVVGPKLIFPDGRISGCGVVGTDENPILRGWQEEDKGQHNKTEEVLGVCGAFFLMKRSVWNKLCGFDERFFLYYEETDLHRRVRKRGYKILYYPFVKVIHYWNKSPKTDRNYFEESKELYKKKWKKEN